MEYATATRTEQFPASAMLRIASLLEDLATFHHEIDIEKFDLVITSYGILRRDSERLSKIGFSYVILDEAQAAKNGNLRRRF